MEEGVTLIINNNTDYNLFYENQFFLEEKDNGTWYHVNHKQAFNLLAITLDPNTSQNHNISWNSPSFSKLTKGNEYRLSKRVYYDNKCTYPYIEFTY